MQRWSVGILAILSIACSSDETSTLSLTDEPNTVQEPAQRFGLIWSTLDVDSGTVRSGQSLSHLLSPAGLSQAAIGEIAEASKPDYDVRSMKSGNAWWLAFWQDSARTPAYFIYQRNAIDYAKFPLEAPYGEQQMQLTKSTIVERAKSVIEQAL